MPINLPSIDQAIIAHLKSLPDVVALCGGRIGPRGDQGDDPTGVRVWQYNEEAVETHQGVEPLAEYACQIDCFATSAEKVSLLARKIRRRLDCFAGDMQGVRIDYMRARLIGPAEPAPPAGSETFIHSASIDLSGLCEIDPSEVDD